MSYVRIYTYAVAEWYALRPDTVDIICAYSALSAMEKWCVARNTYSRDSLHVWVRARMCLVRGAFQCAGRPKEWVNSFESIPKNKPLNKRQCQVRGDFFAFLLFFLLPPPPLPLFHHRSPSIFPFIVGATCCQHSPLTCDRHLRLYQLLCDCHELLSFYFERLLSINESIFTDSVELCGWVIVCVYARMFHHSSLPTLPVVVYFSTSVYDKRIMKILDTVTSVWLHFDMATETSIFMRA